MMLACMLDRRSLLAGVTASVTTGIISAATAATDPLRLVLVHGRAQQGRDPSGLKSNWLNTLRRGALKLGRTLPDTIDVAFPYYGDALDKFIRKYNVPLASGMQTSRSKADDEFLVFQAECAEAFRRGSGVTDAQVDAEYGANTEPKGPLNREWVQAILRALDKYGGGIGGAALESFTRDVFLYTTRADVREEIDRIVANSLTEEPTVMVGHSLGSVVAYSVLRSDRRSLRIPLYLTVGCPLGIRAIRDQFRPLRYPLPVKEWFNAFDTHDIVALHPLDRANFPVTPEIENYAAVKNSTGNRHGIVGYLDDPRVAQRLLDAVGI
ncbi:MAG TPA: hypothetical protein VFP04_03015 [Nitrospira sp.]|nr:hypothetical protein [Nitrospira sp.]